MQATRSLILILSLITSPIVLKAQLSNDTLIIIQHKHANDKSSIRTTVIDTIYTGELNHQIALIGSTVFRGSPNNHRAMLEGYVLNRVEGSECLQELTADSPIKDNKIMSITKNENDFVIDMQIIDKCCNFFLGEIELKNDSTISLNYFPYGYNCDCTCSFDLKFHIEDFDNENKVKFFMINNDKRTLTKFNKNEVRSLRIKQK